MEKISSSLFPEVFKELMYSLRLVCWLILLGVGDVVILVVWIFCMVGWQEKALQLLALCPFFQHLRQSPSRKHLALSAGVSLEMVMASTSMILGSFCGQGVKEEV